jgi:hypothetical protein
LELVLVLKISIVCESRTLSFLGGPRQTVYGTGHIEGPLQVIPSHPKIPGVSQQTVYTPSGGVTVLVGTGKFQVLEFYKRLS